MPSYPLSILDAVDAVVNNRSYLVRAVRVVRRLNELLDRNQRLGPSST